MKKIMLLSVVIIILFPIVSWGDDYSFETITFPSNDLLTITADLYMPLPATAPFILLFHQAGYSRGEYREIAPKLNSMGFNAMAIDQRSGEEVHDVVNETAKLAMEQNLPNTFIDALPDLMAAVEYAKEHYAEGKLIIWGSSYSSGLVLKIAGDYPDIAHALLAFSPGEYYGSLGLGDTFIADVAENITMPVFITSAFSEQDAWQGIYDVIPSADKTFFLPSSGGVHGSSTLLKSTPEHQEYWEAVEQYLGQFTEVETVPDIKVNGLDGPLTVAMGENLSITISLGTGDSEGVERDWWLYTDTPFGTFFWVFPHGWQVDEVRTIALPLMNFNDLPISPELQLPVGTYTFSFSIDENRDGVRDETYSDMVQVTVE